MPITYSDVDVLLVDDFDLWRTYVCSLLGTGHGWKVVGQASDGLEAIQKASELQPDLILLDIGLPKLSGIEAFNRIHEVSPRSQVIFLSQECDPDVVEHALDGGALGYVLKTDAKLDLLPALEVFLRHGKYVSHSLAGR